MRYSFSLRPPSAIAACWLDDVFADDYDLPTGRCRRFINGQELGDIQRKLLQKVEELTLPPVVLKLQEARI